MLPYNHHAYDRRYAVPHGRYSGPVRMNGPLIPARRQHGPGSGYGQDYGGFPVQGNRYPVPYADNYDFPRGGNDARYKPSGGRDAYMGSRHNALHSGGDSNQMPGQEGMVFSKSSHLKRKATDKTPTEQDQVSSRKKKKGNQSDHGSPSRSSTPRSATSSSQPSGKVVYSVPGDGCERITEAIVEYYNDFHQSEDDLRHKIMLSNCLYAIVRNVFPGCRLFIVGSSLSGFGTRTSDMDLCLLVTQQLEIDQRHEAVHILNAIHKALRCCTFVKSSQVIRAKVPILKFTDAKKNIECDLNINNGVGIRNTHLLKYYCMMDARVGPLMLFIKFWARFHDINDAHKRTISSYSLALMLIHYLQVCGPPVLPCLQKLYPQRFSARTDLRSLRLDESLQDYQSRNTASLGKLFLGFLEYYAYRFRPSQDVISIREGGIVSRNKVRFNNGDPAQWKWLCIEEPFDLSNTARSVFDANIFSRVMHVFERSARELRESGDVRSILSQPF